MIKHSSDDNSEVLESPPVPSDTIEQLRQKLAAIEHERWSDWQRYQHSKMRHVIAEIHGESVEGMLMSLSDYQHWERQIATPYDMLSEAEKSSDMEQVDRYWPLIESFIRSEKQQLLSRLLSQKRYYIHIVKSVDGLPQRVPQQAIEIAAIEAEIRQARGDSDG